MERIMYFFIAFLMLVGISACTAELYKDYRDTYSIFHLNDAEGIVVSKKSEQSLFFGSTYLVEVLMTEGTQQAEVVTSESRVSQSQFLNVDLDDVVSGYTVDGKTFLTIRDLIYDGFFYSLFLLLGSIVIVGFIFWLLSKVKPVKVLMDRFMASIGRFIKKFSKSDRDDRGLGSYKILVIISFIIFIIFTFSFTTNLYDKIKPYGKATTEAEVVGSYQDCYLDADRLPICKYMLNLNFFDENGEYVEVNKEVSRHTYRQNSYGDPLQISYLTKNPYNLFINDATFMEIWTVVFSARGLSILFIYTAASLVVFFVVRPEKK